MRFHRQPFVHFHSQLPMPVRERCAVITGCQSIRGAITLNHLRFTRFANLPHTWTAVRGESEAGETGGVYTGGDE
ncbi:hypothetical protein BHM03_00017471 [Ensete ventricosum]|nr:hypothetical protein BHM03_00017471 [Ensete ventricosum]